jgi:hypothetical protein
MRFISISRNKRRVFMPRLEILDDRTLPSVTFVESGHTLAIRGDQNANTILINDDGTANAGNISVQADGQSYTSQGAITTIRVLGRNGADSVEYDLNADLGNVRKVVADLGNGNDTFMARVHGNINDPARLTISASGGNGDDQLSLDAVGANVNDGGSFSVTFNGGNGKDNLLMDYSGLLIGKAAFTANGGNGKDVVTGNLNAESYTLNETGESWLSTGKLAAHFRGDNAVDAMTLHVTGTDDLTSLVARLNGGNGKDTFDATSNVTIVDPPGKKK